MAAYASLRAPLLLPGPAEFSQIRNFSILRVAWRTCWRAAPPPAGGSRHQSFESETGCSSGVADRRTPRKLQRQSDAAMAVSIDGLSGIVKAYAAMAAFAWLDESLHDYAIAWEGGCRKSAVSREYTRVCL